MPSITLKNNPSNTRRQSIPCITIGILISNAIFIPTGFAQHRTAAELYKRTLSATCANCHGTNGKGVINGNIPLIDKFSHIALYSQLSAYKTGNREGTIMPQLSKGYTDDQLHTIADQLGLVNEGPK